MNKRKQDIDSSKATYTSFNENNKSDILNKHNSVIGKFDVINRPAPVLASLAYNIDSTTSIRPPFGRQNYEQFRSNEYLPCKFRDVIRACRSTYLKCGVVRNVIDMMTDFTVEDLKVIHSDKKVEAFIKVWFDKIQIRTVVEEFARHMFIDSNVVVKRTMAKLTKPVENEWKTSGAPKIYTSEDPTKREIPWSYSFLNIAALDWKDSEVSKMSGERQLVFKISKDLVNFFSSNDQFSKQTSDKMPDIKDIITNKAKNGYYELDMTQLYVGHNKKDSWEDWAPPFLYTILADIQFKDKLRQADLAATDGIINVIRLWKLGDHTEGILPNDVAINKLAGILEQSTGGGAIDIIWDSLIDMKEYYPPQDLISVEKYARVDKDILIGLGVPEVLVGGEGANFSNSFIQLKTMVERLKSVRSIVTEWLNAEIKLFCKAMDIAVYPRVRFNPMTLDDENTNKKLIVGLLDRGIISVEAVLNAYGEDYIVETDRIAEEKKVFKKIGVEIKSPFDTNQLGNNDGAPGNGRPSQTKDVTRKTRKPKVRTKGEIELMIRGSQLIDLIDETVLPLYLSSEGIRNARQLTDEQRNEFELMRIGILSCINNTQNIEKEDIIDILKSGDFDQNKILAIQNEISELSYGITNLTIEDKKKILSFAWIDD